MSKRGSLKPIMQTWIKAARTGQDEHVKEPMAGRVVQIFRLLNGGQFGGHTVLVDEPKSFGGGGMAPNPAEVALAALGASISVTCQAYADYYGIPIEGISIALGGELDTRGFFDLDPDIRAGFGEIEVTLTLGGSASQHDLDRLLAQIERSCPVLDMIRNATPVSLHVESGA